ncbi:LOW QUALITY PROTEIN: cholecystokinin receptor type A-like [Scylla paramamosain]|uniref:LOW QUALITY PROTEIN: cholecystokinin receptor type A-like n=1 Tax=Scylla paramamosain TaxID=85552 RepID=UPI003083D0FC
MVSLPALVPLPGVLAAVAAAEVTTQDTQERSTFPPSPSSVLYFPLLSTSHSSPHGLPTSPHASFTSSMPSIPPRALSTSTFPPSTSLQHSRPSSLLSSPRLSPSKRKFPAIEVMPTQRVNLRELTGGGRCWEREWVRIVGFSLIFVVGVVGNVLVVVTLLHHRNLRSLTNVFLLNLAVSDLLLGVFCMPFTLVGSLLQDFVFGALMCRLIPYMQAVSVSVSVWTLVAISLERFYAICQPLRSRRWQTASHAYKVIAGVWASSLLLMTPIAALSTLMPVRGDPGRHKCREVWASLEAERTFTILLTVLLLLVPLVVMAAAYLRVVRTLWLGPHLSGAATSGDGSLRGGAASEEENGGPSSRLSRVSVRFRRGAARPQQAGHRGGRQRAARGGGRCGRPQAQRSLVAKRRVIRMLFVLVAEFFICWTPLFLVNLLSLYIPRQVYAALGSFGVSLVQLLAYLSSCCNPLTYCFMNAKFIQSFKLAFACTRRRPSASLRGVAVVSSFHTMGINNYHQDPLPCADLCRDSLPPTGTAPRMTQSCRAPACSGAVWCGKELKECAVVPEQVLRDLKRKSLYQNCPGEVSSLCRAVRSRLWFNSGSVARHEARSSRLHGGEVYPRWDQRVLVM